MVYEDIVLLLLTLAWLPGPPGANKSEPFHSSEGQPEECNFDLIPGLSEMRPYSAQRWEEERVKREHLSWMERREMAAWRTGLHLKAHFPHVTL